MIAEAPTGAAVMPAIAAPVWRPERVLVIHNRYQQRGGEDTVFEAEVDLLRSAGIDVRTLIISNDHITGISAKITTAIQTLYSSEGRRLAGAAIAEFRPDVMHVHNFFPRLSPSIFDAARDFRVPSVWTLHNYRVACANGMLFRAGAPCEQCLGRAPLPALVHRCYRGSLAGTAAVAGGIALHRWKGTWGEKVSRFIALTEFSRSRMVLAGLPASRIAVKPNFVPTPPTSTHHSARYGGLFVGRLSAEKGVAVLLEAWRGIDRPLTIVGSGPDLDQLRAMAPAGVQFVGTLNRDGVLASMRSAEVLIVPSRWYEGFGMVVAEAMATGTPAIVSDIGSLAELVEDRVTGLRFPVGDAAALASVLRTAFADPERLEAMGHAARQAYEHRLSPERNLELLLEVYRDAALEADLRTTSTRPA